jgi:hypothetical protein
MRDLVGIVAGKQALEFSTFFSACEKARTRAFSSGCCHRSFTREK